MKTATYWISTGLFAFALGASGVAYLVQAEPLVQNVVTTMGYPLHLFPLLGTLKLLGAITLVVPGVVRLKEWAYAGFVFNLVGAVAGHLSTDGVGGAIPAAVLLGVLAVSYATRPEHRNLVG